MFKPVSITIEYADGSVVVLGEESIQQYYDLEAAGRILQPFDPGSGVYVWADSYGLPQVFTPLFITKAVVYDVNT